MRSSPYRPVLTHPVLRRVLPGIAISALGDGMSLVAVSWLALQLAPAGQRGPWVAAAVAAYSLPSALGGAVLGRYLRHRSGAQLAGWNAILRASALAAIVLLFAAGALPPALYIGLLAVSSLLAAWGSAGRYTLIAEILPPEHHLAANGALGTLAEAAAIAGPPLAGLLIGWTNAAVVLAIDAASFAVLALTYRLVPTTPAAAPAARTPVRFGRAQLALLALSFVFFLLFGPFYVALPLHIADDLHASATLLGLYYTVFGIGAAAGGLATAYLRRLPVWPVVLAFGVAVLPLGLGAPPALSLPAFALAGLCWAPYMPIVMAVFQRTTPPDRLSAVLAAFGSITVIAVPVGTAVGGPLVTAVGPERTLLVSAVSLILLGGVAALAGQAAKRATRPISSATQTAPSGPTVSPCGSEPGVSSG
ncbi:MFS transporter [Dactylosporangium sp. McL0621]|uniref:MFS transporter n=1 Tax=Dactylosporangium sp. McL0621 TaxID=3415678 RepID=UPI003CF1517E